MFGKRGPIGQDHKWLNSGEELEIVNDCDYLAFFTNYTGLFVLNQEVLARKGLKALNILLAKLKKYNLTPKTMRQLFDAFVGSILS